MDIEKKINDIVRDKRVLEMGGLGDFENYAKNSFQSWRHLQIKKNAKYVKGIDINRQYVELAKHHGFNYDFGNVEDKSTLNNLGEFEVILLLDVIEHLSNVGTALANMKELLSDNGSLIITTPNPLSLNNILRVLLGKQIDEFHDHTCNIQLSHFKELFLRMNLSLIEYQYFTFSDRNSKHRFKSQIIRLSGKKIPLLNTHILIVGK